MFGSSILSFIWWLQPLERHPLDIGFYVYILAFAFGSSIAHRDSPGRLGLRLDTFGDCARRVAPATFAASAAFAAVGLAAGTWTSPDWPHAFAIVSYTGWALLQQYALQCVVLLRLKDAALDRHAPAAAAALFALMHLPNPGLMMLTFTGGWVWCRAFDRAPNLLPLAFSHAVAALAANLWLPSALVAGLRIGPGYLQQ